MDRILITERTDTCYTYNHDINNDLGIRISSIFVIAVVSSLGSFFPLISNRCKKFQPPNWVFFITKYFGSGVILSTGFIHLLADALELLTDPCIGGTFEDYPWAEAIALMSLFLVFTFDALAHKQLQEQSVINKVPETSELLGCCNALTGPSLIKKKSPDIYTEEISNAESTTTTEISKEKMLNCIILECGIVIHSIFIGLSLAVSNSEFTTLYIALSFHQFFEGLGLGTRFADIIWPRKYWYLPWIMAIIFSLSTPLAIGVGLGIRNSFSIGSRNGLITSGIFDAACGGILIYNSVAELMGYDFIYASEFKSIRSMLLGVFILGLGALSMAIIGNWT